MRIISGGQTGVDRAALDAALELNIEHGGWCPKGRLAELGSTIPGKYQLVETQSSDFNERTIMNIENSDGTLIIVPRIPVKVTDGTILTINTVKSKGVPYLIVGLTDRLHYSEITRWIKLNDIKTLNVAGPRESQAPGIYESSRKILKSYFSAILQDPDQTILKTPKSML